MYKLDTAGKYTILHIFTGGTDGAGSRSVISDGAGNLYGTASGGGTGYGVVYKLDATAHEIVLYTFTGGVDGAYPVSFISDPATGNLYGTTQNGGAYENGWWIGYTRLVWKLCCITSQEGLTGHSRRR